MTQLLCVDSPDLARRRAWLALLAMPAIPALGSGLAACDTQALAPDVNYTLLDGTPGRTAALRGQVWLVNFWATSCGPCVRDMPALAALHRQFAPRGLQTLAVAMQYDPPAAVSHFAQSRQLPFGVVIDNTGAMARAFGDVRVTPTTIVVDRQGRVALRSVGAGHGSRVQALLSRLLDPA